MRDDEKPFRIESSSPGEFRVRVNRSYQRYPVATVYQHGRTSLALETFGAGGLGNEISQMKDAERRDKVNVRTGKDTGSRQDP